MSRPSDAQEAGASVPPQNLEAEEHVIGACLLSVKAIAVCTERVRPIDFYRTSHGVIYAAILRMHADDHPVDAITLADELSRAGTLDDAGGPMRINELATIVPASANAGHYARIVADKARQRRLIAELAPLLDRARNGGLDENEALATLDRARTEITLGSVDAAEPLFVDAHAFAELQVDPPEPFWGSDDTIIIPAGGLALVTGRPGVGKTTWVLDLACHLAAGLPYPNPSDDQAPPAYPVSRPLRVALIENEGPLEMFRDKLSRKLERWPHSIQDAGGYLGIQVWRWGAFSFADPDAFAKTQRELDELAIDLVIGDPLSMLGMEGVGSPEDTRKFVQIIRRLGLGHTRAFLFLHHFRERVERNEDELARISGAWGGHLDTLITLSPMGKEDQARLAFPKLRWGRGPAPKPIILGRVYATASYETIATEGDLTLLEPLIVEYLEAERAAGNTGWVTANTIQSGINRRRVDVKSCLEGAPHLFTSRTGQAAKALGATKSNTVLWGLTAWDDAPPADPEQQQLAA